MWLPFSQPFSFGHFSFLPCFFANFLPLQGSRTAAHYHYTFCSGAQEHATSKEVNVNALTCLMLIKAC